MQDNAHSEPNQAVSLKKPGLGCHASDSMVGAAELNIASFTCF